MTECVEAIKGATTWPEALVAVACIGMFCFVAWLVFKS